MPVRTVLSLRCVVLREIDRRATQRELPPPNGSADVEVDAGETTPDVAALVTIEAETVPTLASGVREGERTIPVAIETVIRITQAMSDDQSTENAPRRKMTRYQSQTPCDAGSKPAPAKSPCLPV
jgi:hypothetical protein